MIAILPKTKFCPMPISFSDCTNLGGWTSNKEIEEVEEYGSDST
jgi:hypothetical protein